ncbi:unnamed protein product, partial [Oppiella nova]
HYIEEARSAAQVAFMNSGTILKQSAPNQLMSEYQCSTLEEVFLQLCYQHNKDKNNANLIEQSSDDSNNLGISNINPIENDLINTANISSKRLDMTRVNAMLMKYWIFIKRKPQFIFIYYTMVIITLCAWNLIVGRDINGISVAVYNNDESPQRLSRMLIHSIDDKHITFVDYPDLESAVNSVRNGRNYLALEFRQNFSDAFETRVTDPFSATDEDVEESLIHLYLDNSNAVIGLMSVKYLMNGFTNFMDKLGNEVGKPNLFDLITPLQITQIYHGNLKNVLNTFDVFGAPMLVVLVLLMPMLLSAFLMVTAKTNNTIERVFVSGVTSHEYYLAHVVVNILISLGLVVISMVVVFVVFNVEHQGSLVEILALLFLQTLVGIAIGLAFSLILADVVSVMKQFLTIS